MQPFPSKLERAPQNHLLITWSDGPKLLYSAAELRDACPCATCREKTEKPPPPANLLPVIALNEAQPLAILGMQPLGNYAYSIAFSDGHDTGIFSFTLLRSLGKPA